MTTPRRSARGQRSYEAIVDAAEPLFFELGFDRTRVEDIAATAHVSVGTVYLHFENKQNVYAAVILRAQDRLLGEYLEPALDLEGTPWQRIEAWMRAYLRFVDENEARARIVALAELEDSESLPPIADAALRERILRFNDRAIQLLVEAREAGELGDIDPIDASRFISGSIYGLGLMNLRRPDLRLDEASTDGAVAAGMALIARGEHAARGSVATRRPSTTSPSGPRTATERGRISPIADVVRERFERVRRDDPVPSVETLASFDAREFRRPR